MGSWGHCRMETLDKVFHLCGDPLPPVVLLGLGGVFGEVEGWVVEGWVVPVEGDPETFLGVGGVHGLVLRGE